MQDGDEESSGEGDAAQAFQALQAEVMSLRQAVEAIPAAVKQNRPVDTTVTLAQLVKELEVVSETLAKLERHPALTLTPSQHAEAIRSAGDRLMNTAAQRLNAATAAAERERHELATMIGSLRGQRAQWKWLAWTGAGGLLLGAMLSRCS